MEKLQESLVKGVPSGDCVFLSGKVKKNSDDIPEEKTLYLSLISAPRVGNSNNTEEEPFGWDSREFLKNLVLGKVVKYTIDYKHNEKLYGQIFFENKLINSEVVKNGYGRVSYGKQQEAMLKTDYYAKLTSAETEAKKAKLNIWTTDQNALSSHKRSIITSNDPEFNSNEILKLCKDGKEIDAIVDFVINCAFFVVYLKDIKTYIKLNLRFVAIPNSKDQAIYKSGKAYIERQILHKDIKVVLYSADENNSFLGDIIDKKGSIATYILKNGYSKIFINNNTPYKTDELSILKQAQAQAKKEKLRVWKNEKGDEENGEEDTDKGFVVSKDGKGKTADKNKNDLEGVCFQVHSGDSISVKTSNGEVVRIFFSHLKAPNLAKVGSNEQDQPWAWQAREYLRKNLVGKKIRCEFDNSKTIPKDNRKMNFYSIIRVDGNKERNFNVELLENGLASYVTPRFDEEISKYLDSYSEAEKTAKEKKVGIHSNKNPGNPNYSDLISEKKKKKEFINFLVNQKNLQCVVEYCFSGSKFKVRIEKNKCMVPFSLLGIKTFSKDKNNTELYDKLFKDSLDFANDNILQREGTCDIISSDKVGNFFGYLTINNTNFATTLLKEGLAVVNTSSSSTPVIYLNEYKNAETAAIQAKKNIWAYENVANFLKEGDVNYVLPSKFEEKNQDVVVRITDYIDFNNFYVNIVPNKTLDQIEAVLENYNQGKKKGTKIEPPIKKGLFCCAKYKNDDRYYRAIVLNSLKGDKYEVEFIDYGTVDVCEMDDLIKMDSSIAAYEPQALLCEFAYLKYSTNSMKKALEKFPDFVNLDLQLSAKVSYTYNYDNRTKYGLVVFLSKKKSFEDTYHNELLKAGFAKLDTKKSLPSYFKELKEIEKKADEKGVGLWAEDEAVDDEETIDE